MPVPRPLLALFALPLLSACVIPIPVPEGTPGAIQVVAGDACGASSLSRSLVGQPRRLAEQVQFLLPSGQPATVRVLGPNDAATMDYNPERANVRVDAAGTVTSVDCG